MNATPTIQDEIDRLTGSLGRLSDRDRHFAASLMDTHETGPRGLSPKQITWVTRLADRAMGAGVQSPTKYLGDFGGVFALMARAAEHLKFPKVRLSTSEGEPVAISVAGPRSKHPGTINVTDGGPYGNNVWYGRIDRDGAWTQSRRPSREATSAVDALLRRLGDDPAGVAAEHGRLTGCCCFCNRALDDERSTEVGYGPVCAKSFGLPWGSRTPAPRVRTRTVPADPFEGLAQAEMQRGN